LRLPVTGLLGGGTAAAVSRDNRCTWIALGTIAQSARARIQTTVVDQAPGAQQSWASTASGANRASTARSVPRTHQVFLVQSSAQRECLVPQPGTVAVDQGEERAARGGIRELIGHVRNLDRHVCRSPQAGAAREPATGATGISPACATRGDFPAREWPARWRRPCGPDGRHASTRHRSLTIHGSRPASTRNGRISRKVRRVAA
jgi:hypothetical protein